MSDEGLSVSSCESSSVLTDDEPVQKKKKRPEPLNDFYFLRQIKSLDYKLLEFEQSMKESRENLVDYLIPRLLSELIHARTELQESKAEVELAQDTIK